MSRPDYGQDRRSSPACAIQVWRVARRWRLPGWFCQRLPCRYKAGFSCSCMDAVEGLPLLYLSIPLFRPDGDDAREIRLCSLRVHLLNGFARRNQVRDAAAEFIEQRVLGTLIAPGENL